MVSVWIPPARAQQTIFDVPSDGITPAGRLFLQNEGQFRPWTPGAFYVGTQYQALGIGHNTELDMTVLNMTSPKAGPVTLGVGAKSAIPLFKEKLQKRQLKLVVGQLIPIALERFQGVGGVGNWSYASVSGRLPWLDTRLQGGVSTGTKQIFGRTNVCFIGGYEKPVTKRLTLIGDWFSGRHSLGLFIPGFSFAFPQNYTLYCGFLIPNFRENGRTGFVVEFARVVTVKNQ
jgi:hypothetical protein